MEANFPGSQLILEQLKNGACPRRRIGIRMEKGPPARHGIEIFTNGKSIGHITSGCPSPSIGENIAMGYVLNDYKQIGTKVELKVRDKFYQAEIVKMPFVKTNYFSVKQ